LNKTNWLNYWDKKNIWTKSDLWKKNIELFFRKTSDIFDYDKKNTVLDIGCGNGDFVNKILSRVNQVFCVDTSQEYINICKTRFSNSKNINVLKLGKDYTDLSFIKNIKFSIIIANSVVQYYNSQKEIIDLVKSVQKIAAKNAHFHNSLINGYFFSLIKIGLKLIVNKEYSKTQQNQPLLIVNLDKLIQDLSIFVKKVTIINKNITINVDRKHLLIQL